MVAEMKYHKELDRLRLEHQSLEDEINNLMRCKVIDQFRLLDLKKKKLKVKESVTSLQALLYRNISA
jgi:hypothetical protein